MKEETLEEVAERFADMCNGNLVSKYSFITGAKWQAGRMYSEAEVRDIVEQTIETFYKHTYADKTKAEMKELWFEQFKKK